MKIIYENFLQECRKLENPMNIFFTINEKNLFPQEKSMQYVSRKKNYHFLKMNLVEIDCQSSQALYTTEEKPKKFFLKKKFDQFLFVVILCSLSFNFVLRSLFRIVRQSNRYLKQYIRQLKKRQIEAQCV